MSQSGTDILQSSMVNTMDYFGAIPLFPIFDWAHFTLSVLEVRGDAGPGKLTLIVNLISLTL